MDTMTVYLDPAKSKKLTIKYIALIIFFIALSVFAIAWLVLRLSFDVLNVFDLILIATPFVSILASYGFVKMIIDMRRALEKGSPILILTPTYIEIKSQRIPINAINKIVRQKEVTFIYATNVKRFVRILPFMRGDYGHKIDDTLISLWEKQKDIQLSSL